MWKMSQPIKGQGGHLVLPIGPKNINLVMDIEILLPVSFRWILFICFRGEVETVSANHRPGLPSCFSDRHGKRKLCRGLWDLVSCFVTWILFIGFRVEVQNVLTNQMPGRPSCFFDWPEKHKLGRGRWDLASCQVSLNSFHFSLNFLAFFMFTVELWENLYVMAARGCHRARRTWFNSKIILRNHVPVEMTEGLLIITMIYYYGFTHFHIIYYYPNTKHRRNRKLLCTISFYALTICSNITSCMNRFSILLIPHKYF